MPHPDRYYQIVEILKDAHRRNQHVWLDPGLIAAALGGSKKTVYQTCTLMADAALIRRNSNTRRGTFYRWEPTCLPLSALEPAGGGRHADGA